MLFKDEDKILLKTGDIHSVQCQKFPNAYITVLMKKSTVIFTGGKNGNYLLL